MGCGAILIAITTYDIMQKAVCLSVGLAAVGDCDDDETLHSCFCLSLLCVLVPVYNACGRLSVCLAITNYVALLSATTPKVISHTHWLIITSIVD